MSDLRARRSREPMTELQGFLYRRGMRPGQFTLTTPVLNQC